MLEGDAESYGIGLPENSTLKLYLQGNTLQAIPDENGEYAGSTKTKTQVMQLLKGSNVHIVNGTVTGNSEADPPTKMVVQNYSNLTISNSVIEDNGTDLYALSNNFGEIHLKDHTKVIATGDHVAFDVWYGMASAYDEGVTVYIDDPTVEIVGKIEYGKANRAKVGDWLSNAHLYVCKGYDLDSLTVVDPNGQYDYVWREAENGYYELKRTIDVTD